MRNKEDVISILANGTLCPSDLGIGLMDNCCHEGCYACWDNALNSKQGDNRRRKPTPPPIYTFGKEE